MDGSEEKADIGYHFGIDKDGNIYQGRPIDVQGAHGDDANTGKIGIVLLADLDTEDKGLNFFEKIFETSDGDVTPKMKEALVNLVGYLNDEYGIDFLGGHKDINCERFCPGDLIQPTLQEMRESMCMEVPPASTGND